MALRNRIGALAALGRYEELERELAQPQEQGAGAGAGAGQAQVEEAYPAALRLGLQAVAAHQLGKKSEEVVFWQRALSTAAGDPRQNWYYELAGIAERGGLPERRMEALALGVEHRLGRPPPSHILEPLSAWLYQRGDTERLLVISARLLRHEPGNASLLNNYHYLRALHGQPARDGAEALRGLVEAEPSRRGYRSSLALVLVRNGDPAAALATLDALGEPAEFSESERAIYAAALAAADRWEEAEALAGNIDWAPFPPTEAEILRALSCREPSEAGEG